MSAAFLTGDNALLLTAFALAFSPVDPLSVAAFAALGVSFPGACPGKDGSLILTKRQHPHFAGSSFECFLFVLLFRFQGAFSLSENALVLAFQYKKALHLPPYGTMQRFYYSQSIIHGDFPCVFVNRRNFHSYGVNR